MRSLLFLQELLQIHQESLQNTNGTRELRVRPTAWTMAALLTIALSLAGGCGEAGSAGADAAANSTDALGGFVLDVGDIADDTSASGADGGVAANGDAAQKDLAAADVAIGPGEFGWPCKENVDCDSGFCLESAEGKVCTVLCSQNCPAGWSCQLAPGTDLVYACVPRFAHLCDPCSQDGDCKYAATGGTQWCLAYGTEGSFCGTECQLDSECPIGFACASETREGKTVGQCRRTSGSCPCSGSAKAGKLTTKCAISSAWGSCGGQRSCGANGLGACSAKVPAVESCNAQDDDCDGGTDEDLPSLPCQTVSPAGACQGKTVCKGGAVACDGPKAATETCNGQDDDCDGQTDEQSCNDGNLCTEDACNTQLGGCLFAMITKSCDDGDVCTSSDLCTNGVCVGSAVSCDDGKPCTIDSCSAKGCEHKAQLGAACDDGNPCTSGEVCNIAAGSSAPTCAGVALADGASCTDAGGCALAASCKSGACTATISACDDANLCTDDGCNSLPGGVKQCQHQYNLAACDDGNPCTQGDSCLAGKCIGQGKQGCDDQDPCTADSCDPAKGCTHAAKSGSPCSDSNLCTTDDKCGLSAGKVDCVGTPLACSDGNQCTSDSCNPLFGCSYSFVSAPCDDGDKCTTGDLCAAGKCTPGNYTCGECVVNQDCKVKEDGNLCNGTLFCEPSSHTCQTDPATVVQCPKPVGGGAVCVVSACDAKSGKCAIQTNNNGGACDDGNACTSGDACKGGICQGSYGGLACDDGNPCTQDLCDPAKGCTSQSLDGVTCSDGNLCSIGDACKNGVCTAGATLGCDDANPCTADGCNPKTGCVHNVHTLPCDDGNVCTEGDTCKDAVCSPQKAFNCDDSNPCTTDGCDAKTGCKYVPANGLQCSDGNACTSADACKSGQCLGGGQLPCSDGNPCTNDGCDPKNGCVFTPNTIPCSDGNACTDLDACQGAACKSGKPTDCNDANTCTQDLCDPAKGCIYVKIVDGTPCNDGDSCTANDKCTTGMCQPGTKVTCNDNEACTADSCNPKTGCVFTGLADKEVCEDGNPCTIAETCKSAKCTPGGKKDSDGDGHFPTTCGGDDCDDNSANAYPGLVEVCDDVDNDCKSGVDDGCDDDNDDFCDKNVKAATGMTPKTCSKGGGDCNDAVSTINPGAAEKLEADIDHRSVPQAITSGQTVFSGSSIAVGANGTLWFATIATTTSYTPVPTKLLAVFSLDGGDLNWNLAFPDELRDANAPSLAVDTLGRPHVAYQSVVDKTMRHAWLTNTGWANEELDPQKGIGDYSAIAVSPGGSAGGKLHVAYYDAVGGDVRYATNVTGKWVATVVETTHDVGQYVAIAGDKNGAAHLIYLDYSQQDLRYATDQGSPGTFATQLLDGATSAAGFYASLAIDDAGSLHAAYYELLASDLRYAVRSGGSWKTETVDSAGTVGQYTSIVADGSGNVHIGYVDVDKALVKLASGKAGTWTLLTGGAITAATPRVGMAGGDPVMGYPTANSGVQLATKKGNTFNYVNFASGIESPWAGSGTGAFVGPRIGTPSAGQVIVAGNSVNGQIFGRWLGTSYEWRLFADQPKVIAPGSFALASDGTVHICGSFLKGGTGLGHMTFKWPDQPLLTVVDASAKSGNPCSIALAGSTAHIVYYDLGNQVMRYASVTGGTVSSLEIPDPSFGTGTVQDIAVRADGSIETVYGGKNLRSAIRKNGAWSIETLQAEPTLEVAQTLGSGSSRHVVFRQTTGGKAYYFSGSSGAWSTPTELTGLTNAAVGGLAIHADGVGNVHGVGAGQQGLTYFTNRFGSWSYVPLGVTSSSYVPANTAISASIALGSDNRVFIAGILSNWPATRGVALTLTFQNLVDDNCDGK